MKKSELIQIEDNGDCSCDGCFYGLPNDECPRENGDLICILHYDSIWVLKPVEE